jgi:hypothetical protein
VALVFHCPTTTCRPVSANLLQKCPVFHSSGLLPN